MKTIRKLAGAVLMMGAFFLSGCAISTVSVDYDKQVDFGKYRTFRFQPGHIVRDIGVHDTVSSLINIHMRRAVEAQLTAKGYQVVDSNPDFIVSYIAGAQEKEQIVNNMNNFGPMFGPYYGFYGMGMGGGWWGPMWNNTWSNNMYYEEGTLVIDVLDPKTNNLIWRSFAESVINNYNEAAFVEKEVTKSLKKFPDRIQK